MFGTNTEAWMADGLCRQVDHDLFFPEVGDGKGSRDAKKTCQTCPVTQDCLEYALRNKERNGIWGGMSEAQRRKLWAAA